VFIISGTVLNFNQMRIKIFTLSMSLILISCSTKQRADLLVYNAQVYTADEQNRVVSAFVVKDGVFVAVGDEQTLRKTYYFDAEQDLKKQTVLPGLIDAHAHFYGLGLFLSDVDLVGTQSEREVLDRLLATYPANSKTALIRGRGWDQNDWESGVFPHKSLLDSLYPDTPVVLERIDGHSYWVNQVVLDLAGINAQTKVAGGFVVMDSGEPTGVLIDGPMSLVDAFLPQKSPEDQQTALLMAQTEVLSYGITALSDAGLDRQVIELMDQMHQQNKLQLRIDAMISNTAENLDYYLPKGVYVTPKLRVGSVKVYGDGALGSRGAALKRPYADYPGHFGAMVTPVEAIEKLAHRLAKTDFQMNTHAIGDSANAVVLNAYQKVLADKPGRRWRLEHAQIIDGPDIPSFSSDIIPSVQPTHATSDMYWAEKRLGSERMNGAYAYARLLKQSGILALGTDFPVEQVNPFLTFYAATTRQDTSGWPEGGFLPDEALSRTETLWGMTRWAAYAMFREQEIGSIEVGKRADFCVLDRDIMEVRPQDIPQTKVLATFIDGLKVY
jgi:predicted amidohydrolase YtcJ